MQTDKIEKTTPLKIKVKNVQSIQTIMRVSLKKQMQNAQDKADKKEENKKVEHKFVGSIKFK